MLRIDFKPSFKLLLFLSLLVSVITAFAFSGTAVATFFYGAIFHDWERSALAAVILLASLYLFYGQGTASESSEKKGSRENWRFHKVIKARFRTESGHIV